MCQNLSCARGSGAASLLIVILFVLVSTGRAFAQVPGGFAGYDTAVELRVNNTIVHASYIGDPPDFDFTAVIPPNGTGSVHIQAAGVLYPSRISFGPEYYHTSGRVAHSWSLEIDTRDGATIDSQCLTHNRVQVVYGTNQDAFQGDLLCEDFTRSFTREVPGNGFASASVSFDSISHDPTHAQAVGSGRASARRDTQDPFGYSLTRASYEAAVTIAVNGGPNGGTVRIHGYARVDESESGINVGQPGDNQENPYTPSTCEVDDSFWCFLLGFFAITAWCDPPMAEGYRFAAEAPVLFTQIADFPTGFAYPLTVSVSGVTLGAFGPGQPVIFSNFAAQLGSLLVDGQGVAGFEVHNIKALVNSADPTAFPIKLGFNQNQNVAFSMQPLKVGGPCAYDVNCSGTTDTADLCAWYASPIDFNGDAQANTADVAALAAFIGVPLSDANNNGRADLCDCLPADVNYDGVVTPSDIASFVNAWVDSLQTGSLAGDFNGNWAVEPSDVAAFVSTWFNALTNGC